MKKLLTDKQALAVQGIKDRCQEAGLAIPTPQIVTSAHQAAYKTKTRDGARAIASRNLQKPEFREALQLDSPEMRSEIGTIIQQGLRGELKLWPADREVFLACLKLAARINFAACTGLAGGSGAGPGPVRGGAACHEAGLGPGAPDHPGSTPEPAVLDPETGQTPPLTAQ